MVLFICVIWNDHAESWQGSEAMETLNDCWQYSKIGTHWDPAVPPLSVYQGDKMAQFFYKDLSMNLYPSTCEWVKWDIYILSWWLKSKYPPLSPASSGDTGSILGSGRQPGGENGTHSSILPWEIPPRGTCQWTKATVRGASKKAGYT